jgi:hypothetical protein
VVAVVLGTTVVELLTAELVKTLEVEVGATVLVVGGGVVAEVAEGVEVEDADGDGDGDGLAEEPPAMWKAKEYWNVFLGSASEVRFTP